MGKPEFVKFQTKMLDSSLIDLDIECRWCWTSLLLMVENFDGDIYGTVSSMARRANVPTKTMEKALDIFTSPDENSSTSAEEGRRILNLGNNKWKVVNFVKYLVAPDAEIRKQDYRITKQKQRTIAAGEEWNEMAAYMADCEKYGLPLRTNVLDILETSTHRDIDIDIDIDNSSSSVISNTEVSTCNNSNTGVPSRKPVAKNPPTVEEVFQHIQDKGYKGNEKALALAEQIVEHHNNGGQWRTGAGKPIYVWKSHVNQWIENRKGTLTPNVGKLFQKQRQAEELAKRGK